ncbi:histidine phosphatase family protein [Paraburkholderia unamae]|uniref:Phosphoglycerate mutase n=1 Tax=Paraburkholderia unamae TaxID=219649 RepID=A0ABX5K8Y4_9BURK|nr:histidine phosphatase family protein [Paraburkholderia unamae]PVX60041.1 putative phosphoglycerate mutase [Paraburkholderia unamae]CAG9274331.1 Acid phosphatase [Paraburkholderia unamae]
MSANPAEVSPGVREVWLIRHGETLWSRSGQHTGSTDIALTEHGREQARSLAATLAAQRFDAVLCSPMARAIETCQLAGLGAQMTITADLHEWDYGIYEGRTTAEIHRTDPGWSVWHSPIPQGEDLARVQARAAMVVENLLAMRGRVALVSHAHFLRALAGCWVSGSAALGAHLYLDTASVSILGFDHECRAIRRWNALGESRALT